jgi:hypothetical protein
MAAGRMKWGHLLVLALILPLALSSALPAFARVIAGPTPHVCHCQMSGGRGAMSDCPICNPDRDDLWLTEAALRGTCGDEDLVFGATLGVAVLAPPGVTILPPEVAREALPDAPLRLAAVFVAPPTPPPRSALS